MMKIKQKPTGMHRILVIGCPGSGKSTFARRLHDLTELPLYYLDMLFWNGDQTTVPREVFLERLDRVLTEPRWIIDGNYAFSMERRIEKADTIFFLDYPTEVCLSGVMERRGKDRPDMPWIEPKEQEPDPEFLEQIRNFPQKERARILDCMERYGEKNWIIFKNREEAEIFFENQPK